MEFKLVNHFLKYKHFHFLVFPIVIVFLFLTQIHSFEVTRTLQESYSTKEWLLLSLLVQIVLLSIVGLYLLILYKYNTKFRQSIREIFSIDSEFKIVVYYLAVLFSVPFLSAGFYYHDSMVLVSWAKTFSDYLASFDFPNLDFRYNSGEVFYQLYGYAYFFLVGFLMLVLPNMFAAKLFSFLINVFFTIIVYNFTFKLTNKKYLSLLSILIANLDSYRAGFTLTFYGHQTVGLILFFFILSIYQSDKLLSDKPNKSRYAIDAAILFISNLMLILTHVGWAFVGILLIGVYTLSKSVILYMQTKQFNQIVFTAIIHILSVVSTSFLLYGSLFESEFTVWELYFREAGYSNVFFISGRYHYNTISIILTVISTVIIFAKKMVKYIPMAFVSIAGLSLVLMSYLGILGRFIPILLPFASYRFLYFVTVISYVQIFAIYETVQPLKFEKISFSISKINLSKIISQMRSSKLLIFKFSIIALLLFENIIFFTLINPTFVNSPTNANDETDRLSAYNWIEDHIDPSHEKFLEVPNDNSRKLDQPSTFRFYLDHPQIMGTNFLTGNYAYKYSYQLMNLMHYFLYPSDEVYTSRGISNLTEIQTIYYTNKLMELSYIFNLKYVISNSDALNLFEVIYSDENVQIHQLPVNVSFGIVSKKIAYNDFNDFYQATEVDSQSIELGLNIYDANPFALSNNYTYTMLDFYDLNLKNGTSDYIISREVIDENIIDNDEPIQINFNHINFGKDTIKLDYSLNSDVFIQLPIAWHPDIQIFVDNTEINYFQTGLNLVGLKLIGGNHTVEISSKPPFLRQFLFYFDLLLISSVLIILTNKKSVNRIRLHLWKKNERAS